MPEILRAALFAAVSKHDQVIDEKVSIPSQIADGRALAEARGWSIVRQYVIPGHSRYYINLDEMIDDMVQRGFTDYRDLRDDWQHQRFDRLIIRTGDRLARTPALIGTVIESIVRVGGANIVQLQGIEIDGQNYPGVIAMLSWQIGQFMISKNEGADKGLDKRMERGLPMSQAPLTHKVVRDDKGKAVSVYTTEDQRRLLDRLAALLLARPRLSIDRITQMLAEDGFTNPKTGKQFTKQAIWQTFYSPFTWGHSARHFGSKYGHWGYDLDLPVPAGVKILRNTHEAIWVGDQAEQIIEELRARRLQGSSRAPLAVTRFTSLLVCSECQSRLVPFTTHKRLATGLSKRYVYFTCPAHYRGIECLGNPQLKEPEIWLWLDRRLREVLEVEEGIDLLLAEDSESGELVTEAARLRREITGLSRRLDVMVSDSSLVEGNAARASFRRKIDELGVQIDALTARLSELQSRIGSALSHGETQRRMITFEELRTRGIDWLWSLSDAEINELLRRLFGSYRLIVEGKNIIGIGVAGRRPGPIPKR